MLRWLACLRWHVILIYLRVTEPQPAHRSHLMTICKSLLTETSLGPDPVDPVNVNPKNKATRYSGRLMKDVKGKEVSYQDSRQMSITREL